MVKNIFTFLWVDQAHPEFYFRYEGIVEGCRECSYMKVCHGSLIAGQIYSVVKIREKVVDCKISNLKAQLVEVKPSNVEAAVDSRHAIEKAIIIYMPQQCPDMSCERFDVCVPNLLDERTNCKVIKVGKSFTCSKKKIRLVRVSLQPSEAPDETLHPS